MLEDDVKSIVESAINNSIHRIVQQYGDIGRNDTQIAENLEALNNRFDIIEKHIKGDPPIHDGLVGRIQVLEKRDKNRERNQTGLAAGVSALISAATSWIQNNIT